MRQEHELRTFFVLLVTQTASVLGSSMTGFAVGLWVFERTGHATPFLIVALVTVLLRTLVGSVAGALVDRWDRRIILLLADSGQALATIALGASVLATAFQLWHLYLVAAVQASLAMFQEPALQAAITLLVRGHQRARANAMRQVVNAVTGILAPLLAGWLYLLVGLVGILVVDAMTFVAALLALALVRIPRPAPSSPGVATSVGHDVRAGFRFVRGRRGLFWVFVLLGVVNPVFLSVYRLYLPYILLRTGDPAVLGTILSSMSLGGVCGGLLLAAWGGAHQGLRMMLAAIVVSALLLIVVGVSRSAVALGCSLFGLMLIPPFIHVPLTTLIQDTVPADFQGRTFALLSVMAQGLTPLGYMVVGPLVDQVLEPAVGQPVWAYVAPLVGTGAGAGMGLLMVAGGSLVVVLTLLMAMSPALRSLDGQSF